MSERKTLNRDENDWHTTFSVHSWYTQPGEHWFFPQLQTSHETSAFCLSDIWHWHIVNTLDKFENENYMHFFTSQSSNAKWALKTNIRHNIFALLPRVFISYRVLNVQICSFLLLSATWNIPEWNIKQVQNIILLIFYHDLFRNPEFPDQSSDVRF